VVNRRLASPADEQMKAVIGQRAGRCRVRRWRSANVSEMRRGWLTAWDVPMTGATATVVAATGEGVGVDFRADDQRRWVKVSKAIR
jgi:hypothetical protein